MGIFLIGYDLKGGTESEYEDLIKAIKGLTNSYWHCLDSTWLIDHPGPASKIRDALKPHLEKPDDKKAGDKLLVATMAKGAAWTLSFPDDCQSWLKSHL